VVGLITRLVQVLTPSARPGRYNPDLTPWVEGILDALDDSQVTEVVAMKGAQVAWTDGVLNNYIGKRIDLDPCPMIVMFAKDQAAKEYNDEKFVPMVEATPHLACKIPVHKTRDRDNRNNFKSFPGGFLKFVGSNSPSSVKSTPAPVVAIEEPDDCNENLKDQGDTITLLKERTKTYARRKVIFGGTPTIEGISRVEAAYKGSDQRKFYVPCHHCNEAHALMWENVRWQSDPELQHEVFGKARPDTAYYICPHCGGLWNDVDKNRNVRQGIWRAGAAFYGIAGFYINELNSPFPGSTLQRLVEKRLVAEHALAQGDDTKMRSFRNNTEGLAYAYQTDLPDIEALRARAEDYAELLAPWGVLVVTAGVDVQHDRLAISIVGWGKGEESWRLYWGEIHGQTSVKEQGAWIDLDALLSKPVAHVSGAQLRIRAVSIDSSDGQTADAVYDFVRKRMGRNFMAVKGGSDQGSEREIFCTPQVSVDKNRLQKAHAYGLRPFIVGVQRAKDLLLGQDAGAGRLKLTGTGPGRMHWYSAIRPDWYEQVTSEVKAPHRTIRNRKVWQKKAGVRNEALDTEVYALHAARSLKINLWKDERWQVEEARIRQPDLLTAVVQTPIPESTPDKPAQENEPKPAPRGLFNTQRKGNWTAKIRS
jgi:phage terminase large subunit GpA-like protein